MLRPNAFLPLEARGAVASLAILAVPARTLRSPTAGIGTEFPPHREKIELTRSGSPFERSPVPMGRAHRPYTAQFAIIPGECLKPETRWRRGVDSNYRFRMFWRENGRFLPVSILRAGIL
jgi:hypothetical protein